MPICLMLGVIMALGVITAGVISIAKLTNRDKELEKMEKEDNINDKM